jgi:hypothetical protein
VDNSLDVSVPATVDIRPAWALLVPSLSMLGFIVLSETLRIGCYAAGDSPA